MKNKLHFICYSCGEEFKYPQKQMDCDKCKKKFMTGTKYTKCKLCDRPVVNAHYPLCPDCYYKIKRLDELMYKQYMEGK